MIDKKSILFYAGNFNANSITKMFLNLVNNIDLDRYDISICVEMRIINKSEDRKKEFNKLKKEIKIIPRTGRILMSIEEKKIWQRFESEKKFETDEMEYIYRKIYENEYRRIFANNYFDAIIHFEGYNLFWQRVFAYAPSSMVGKKSIYQHYDMYKIWKEKYSILEYNFLLYKEFDNLISTSKKLCFINSEQLSILFNLNKNRFTYVNKIHNHKQILEDSKKGLSENNLFFNTKVFINIARLSKENGQEMILEAFKKVVSLYPDTRLVYLGTGDLEKTLRVLIKKNSLQGKVFLLGQRYNPSAYLQKSDCLVDASGSIIQSMVLKEAYYMRKPIITTDTENHRRVLNGKLAIFVEEKEESLLNGMLRFLNQTPEDSKIFNYELYNQNILDKFYTTVVF